jgi:hypothetical protein
MNKPNIIYYEGCYPINLDKVVRIREGLSSYSSGLINEENEAEENCFVIEFFQGTNDLSTLNCWYFQKEEERDYVHNYILDNYCNKIPDFETFEENK